MTVELNRGRTVRGILSMNVKALMAVCPELDSSAKIGRASHGRLTHNAVGRILKRTNSPTLDTVAVLAEVFSTYIVGLKPWHLLYGDLDPQKLPICVSDDEREIVERVRRVIVRSTGPHVDDSIEGNSTRNRNGSASRTKDA